MLFPSPSGCFDLTIKRKKKGSALRPTKSDAEIFEKVYSSKTMDMKVDSKLGWELKPCKTTVDSMNIDDSPPLKTIINIEKGEKLKFKRLVRFLSNHGQTNHLVRFQKGCYGEVDDKVAFDSLRKKQLLICCFEVPMFSDSYAADQCRAVIEMYDHHGQPFELVVVVKMRTDVANYDQKSAFNHFYSAFSSCLAVPLSDVETRDYICACFTTSFDQKVVDCAILVDPKGLILEAGETLINFLNYGYEWSPPTLEEIDEQDHMLRCRFDPIYASRDMDDDFDNNKDRSYLSLYRDILLCSPHRTLRRFDSDNDDVDAAASTVLDLSTKYVGLYLCHNGSIMEEIKAAHDHCLANKQQLEIVLVCISLFEEPPAYYHKLYQTLRLFNIKSWFLFDYDSMVCRRLWRIFGFGPSNPLRVEKFIIVPPNCESGELLGREVITYNGVTEYPFTRSAMMKRRLEELRSLTPLHSTLFKTATLFHKGKEFDYEQLLRGKNLILYLDSCVTYERTFFGLLMEHYPKMKGMGWEVVYVPLEVAESYMEEQDEVHYRFYASDSQIKKMPWPVMSPSAVVEACVNEIMAFPPNKDGEQHSRLVAVRKDGNIVSIGAEQRLKRDGVTESLFDDVLERDMALEMSLMPQIEDETCIPIRY